MKISRQQSTELLVLFWHEAYMHISIIYFAPWNYSHIISFAKQLIMKKLLRKYSKGHMIHTFIVSLCFNSSTDNRSVSAAEQQNIFDTLQCRLYIISNRNSRFFYTERILSKIFNTFLPGPIWFKWWVADRTEFFFLINWKKFYKHPLP